MTTYQFGLSLNEDEINWIKGLDDSVDTENLLAGILAGKMAESEYQPTGAFSNPSKTCKVTLCQTICKCGSN